MAKTRKQLEIVGAETKKIREVDDAAEAYVEARDERMELTEKEVEAKGALLQVMKKHSLTVYKDESADPPLVVTVVEGQDDVKVKKAKPPKAKGDES